MPEDNTEANSIECQQKTLLALRAANQLANISTKKNIVSKENLDNARKTTLLAETTISVALMGTVALNQVRALNPILNTYATNFFTHSGYINIAASGLGLIFSLMDMSQTYHLAKKHKLPHLIKEFWLGESGLKTFVSAGIGLFTGIAMVVFFSNIPILTLAAVTGIIAINFTELAFNAAKTIKLQERLKKLKQLQATINNHDMRLSTQKLAIISLSKEELVKAQILNDHSDESVESFLNRKLTNEESKKLRELLIPIQQNLEQEITQTKKELQGIQKRLFVSSVVTIISITGLALAGLGTIAASPIMIGIGATIMTIVSLFGLSMMIKSLIDTLRDKKQPKTLSKENKAALKNQHNENPITSKKSMRIFSQTEEGSARHSEKQSESRLQIKQV